MSEYLGVAVLGDASPEPGAIGRGAIEQGTPQPGAFARWLRDTIRHPVEIAAELPVELLSADAAGEDAAPLPARLRRKFCVGAHLAPATADMLAAHAIPHLDIRIHPLRFLDDLLFAARPSRLDTRAALSPFAVPRSIPLIIAGLRAAMCRLIADSRLPPNTLLAVGADLSGPAFVGLDVPNICAAHSAVLVRSRENTPPANWAPAIAGVPNPLGTTRDNLYRLLAMPEISGVLTGDASVAEEARWFGKAVHGHPADAVPIAWRDDAPNEGGTSQQDYLSFDDFLLCADFWRVALAPHTSVTPPDGCRLPGKPNRLRISLNSFGEFHEIDTDRIPVGPAP